MAFDITKFGLNDSGMNSDLPREWAYTTTDTAATVDTVGYFNSMAKFLKVGDTIRAKCSTGGTATYNTFFVSANSGTVVDVNDSVVYSTTTDTD
jgi:hypothetical protein